jgi:hypothetical protein
MNTITAPQASEYQDKPLTDDISTRSNYNQALGALANNPLLFNTHWATQLRLTAQNQQTVLDYYDFVDAQMLTDTLYPLWQVGNPLAAIAKQAQRQTLLYIERNGQKLYPVQQFDTDSAKPALIAEFKILIAKTREHKLTNMELLHWLCTAVPVTLPNEPPLLEQHLNEADYESALNDIIQSGPSKVIELRPVDIARQGNTVLFKQLLSQWLSPEPVAITPEQRTVAAEHLKAQMVALGIDQLTVR